MTLTGAIGTIAAICTTGAFVPQIIKIRKQGGGDVSYLMLFVYLMGLLLWLGYGLLFHAPAVIWANIVAVVLVSTSVILKATWTPTASERRLRVAIDMDEVIVNTLPRHLELYNSATGENLSPELIAQVGLEAAVPAKYRDIFDNIPHQDGFFEDLDIIEHSQRALRLLDSQFDLFITSAAMEVPSSFDAKFKWLQKHFPFIPPSRIVFCGDKEIVNADYLIDDRSRHFARFRGTGILFTAPHNARERARLRANSWDDVLAILPKPRTENERTPATELAKAEA
ncbi:MAG TPA: PQ-loop domain-containing transporter [Terriglobales bacterium]